LWSLAKYFGIIIATSLSENFGLASIIAGNSSKANMAKIILFIFTLKSTHHPTNKKPHFIAGVS
jgi:hypothetical protein